MRYLFYTLSVVVWLLGCGQQPAAKPAVQSAIRSQPPVSTNMSVLKIAVSKDGRLTVDGAPSSMVALRESLQRLSKQSGVVWYYREAGQQEPPAIAMEAMQAVIEARLPIRLSSRPDFSDSIGFDGRPIAN